MNLVALDIGGTNIRAAIINQEGTIVEVKKDATLRHDKSMFMTQVKGMIASLGLATYKPLAISIGVPGRVRSNGFINELPNIGIKDIDLVTPLKETFGIPVFIRNDAEMAAFAEASSGAGKAAKSTYFVTISTGIGGCLVVDHQIKNPSAEIGHTLVPYHGQFYEIEKIASGDGVITLAAINGIYYPNGKAFFDDVEKKAPYTLKVFNDWLDLIVDFFRYIQDAFTPEVIAVTGGVLKSKHLFWEELNRRVNPANIVLASFSEDAGLIGAAAYGFTKLTKQSK